MTWQPETKPIWHVEHLWKGQWWSYYKSDSPLRSREEAMEYLNAMRGSNALSRRFRIRKWR